MHRVKRGLIGVALVSLLNVGTLGLPAATAASGKDPLASAIEKRLNRLGDMTSTMTRSQGYFYGNPIQPQRAFFTQAGCGSAVQVLSPRLQDSRGRSGDVRLLPSARPEHRRRLPSVQHDPERPGDLPGEHGLEPPIRVPQPFRRRLSVARGAGRLPAPGSSEGLPALTLNRQAARRPSNRARRRRIRSSTVIPTSGREAPGLGASCADSHAESARSLSSPVASRRERADSNDVHGGRVLTNDPPRSAIGRPPPRRGAQAQGGAP